jgi:hypothetical protein
LGTKYTLRHLHISSDGETSRNTTIIAVICLVSRRNHVVIRAPFLLTPPSPLSRLVS